MAICGHGLLVKFGAFLGGPLCTLLVNVDAIVIDGLLHAGKHTPSVTAGRTVLASQFLQVCDGTGLVELLVVLAGQDGTVEEDEVLEGVVSTRALVGFNPGCALLGVPRELGALVVEVGYGLVQLLGILSAFDGPLVVVERADELLVEVGHEDVGTADGLVGNTLAVFLLQAIEILLQHLEVVLGHLYGDRLVEPTVALQEVLRVVGGELGLDAELFDRHFPGVLVTLAVHGLRVVTAVPVLAGEHTEHLGHNPASEETAIGNGTLSHDAGEDGIVLIDCGGNAVYHTDEDFSCCALDGKEAGHVITSGCESLDAGCSLTSCGVRVGGGCGCRNVLLVSVLDFDGEFGATGRASYVCFHKAL